MRHSRLLSAAAIAGLAFSGLAAEADTCRTEVVDESVEIELCEIPTWVKDPGHKAGNAAITGAVEFPFLSGDAPDASVTAGAGGGYAGSLGQGANGTAGPESTLTVDGSFTGLIDSMHLTLHALVYNGYGSTGTPTDRKPHSAYVEVDVDGAPLVFQTEVEFLTTEAPDANAAMQFDVVLTGLYDFMVEAHVFDGVSLEPDAEHTIQIRVTPRYVNTDAVVVYVYDTTEVPSSVVFNPAVLPEGVPAY